MNKYEKRMRKLRKKKNELDNLTETLANQIESDDPIFELIKFDIYKELDDLLKKIIKRTIQIEDQNK